MIERGRWKDIDWLYFRIELVYIAKYEKMNIVLLLFVIS